MVNKKDFGPPGMKMEPKNLKGNLVTVKEIVFGPPGTKMETKSFRLLTQTVN